MEQKIYVVGHKNPDTDSICSALAYANLKQALKVNAIPCRLGPLSEETKYVLKKFKIEGPDILKDARTQLCDIAMDNCSIIHKETTVKEAWDTLYKAKNKSLFVLGEEEKLIGIVSTSNLASTRMMDDKQLQANMKTATQKAICKTIKGTLLHESSQFKNNGKVYIVTLNDGTTFGDNFKSTITILSDGVKKQRQYLEMGVKCLIITCGQEISSENLELARKLDCAIIATALDTMKVARVIYESFPIANIMSHDPITFQDDEYVDDVSKKMANTRFRSYPVLNDEYKMVGAVSRYHLLSYNRKKFILVDHSAKNQAIDNIGEGDIEEIVDHHHIGNIETTYPVMFRNQKCGCTSTIISQIYEEKGIVPSASYAGLMLSAIISDTLNFKSQTTTELDRTQAVKLAKLAKVNLDVYAVEMLSASVALKDTPYLEILNRDLKIFEMGRYTVAIGQTNYSNLQEIQALLPDFRETLEKEQLNRQYDLMIMMFTHVLAEGTMFVFSGSLSYIMQDVIATKFDSNSGYDHDIISRKQQLMPKISTILKML